MEKNEFVTLYKFGNLGFVPYTVPKTTFYQKITKIYNDLNYEFEYIMSKTYITDDNDEVIGMKRKIHGVYVTNKGKLIVKFNVTKWK